VIVLLAFRQHNHFLFILLYQAKVGTKQHLQNYAQGQARLCFEIDLIET
jgi:hypothetical protein